VLSMLHQPMIHEPGVVMVGGAERVEPPKSTSGRAKSRAKNAGGTDRKNKRASQGGSRKAGASGSSDGTGRAPRKERVIDPVTAECAYHAKLAPGTYPKITPRCMEIGYKQPDVVSSRRAPLRRQIMANLQQHLRLAKGVAPLIQAAVDTNCMQEMTVAGELARHANRYTIYDVDIEKTNKLRQSGTGFVSMGGVSTGKRLALAKKKKRKVASGEKSAGGKRAASSGPGRKKRKTEDGKEVVAASADASKTEAKADGEKKKAPAKKRGAPKKDAKEKKEPKEKKEGKAKKEPKEKKEKKAPVKKASAASASGEKKRGGGRKKKTEEPKAAEESVEAGAEGVSADVSAASTSESTDTASTQGAESASA